MYATKRQLLNMDKVNKRSLEVLEEFIGSLESLEFNRALDVAGGDGRVSKELLCGL